MWGSTSDQTRTSPPPKLKLKACTVSCFERASHCEIYACGVLRVRIKCVVWVCLCPIACSARDKDQGDGVLTSKVVAVLQCGAEQCHLPESGEGRASGEGERAGVCAGACYRL